MKSYELAVPLYKRGDDLGHHVDALDCPRGALLAYAEQLKDAVRVVERAAEAFKNKELEIIADTHVIQIEGDQSVIDMLVAEEILHVWEFDCDEDEDFDDTEDEE